MDPDQEERSNRNCHFKLIRKNIYFLPYDQNIAIIQSAYQDEIKCEFTSFEFGTYSQRNVHKLEHCVIWNSDRHLNPLKHHVLVRLNCSAFSIPIQVISPLLFLTPVSPTFWWKSIAFIQKAENVRSDLSEWWKFCRLAGSGRYSTRASSTEPEKKFMVRHRNLYLRNIILQIKCQIITYWVLFIR